MTVPAAAAADGPGARRRSTAAAATDAARLCRCTAAAATGLMPHDLLGQRLDSALSASAAIPRRPASSSVSGVASSQQLAPGLCGKGDGTLARGPCPCPITLWHGGTGRESHGRASVWGVREARLWRAAPSPACTSRQASHRLRSQPIRAFLSSTTPPGAPAPALSPAIRHLGYTSRCP